MNDRKKIVVKIDGMHCASCEVLIERRLRKIPGVEHVSVHQARGEAVLRCSKELTAEQLQEALKGTEYQIGSNDEQPAAASPASKRHHLEIGAIFLILLGLYVFLKRFDLLPQGLGITDNMSYGFVFLLGLVAAASTCLAVTGGLLVAAAAKYNEMHPNLTGRQKFKPHLYFNIGRVASYAILGGLVGTLGSVLTLSSRSTGIMIIIASLVMILLGVQLLHVFPWLNRFQPKMPEFLAHKIHDASGKQHKAMPFVLGAATFFLPCGFTQALQIYVLSTGSFVTGAMTMLAFSLGTAPALLSLSAISSFARGAFQRYFLKTAAVVVVLLGIFNMSNGFALAGIDLGGSLLPAAVASTATLKNAGVELVDGEQVARMQVVGLDYSPYRFTVVQGVPVRWEIDGKEAGGCAQIITIPSLGITEYLTPGSVKTIRFTPTEPGVIPFSCPMGMTTRGAAFDVVPNPNGNAKMPSADAKVSGDAVRCDPTTTDCEEVQRLSMEISRERGFYPNTFTVKKGVPVELEIDTKIPLGGCMSTMVIPTYNIAHALKQGKTALRFTPTEEGTVPWTCAMGARMGEFNVIA